MTQNSSIDRIAKSLFIVLFMVLAFYFFSSILMPILFSGIAALILVPMVNFFERIRLGKTFSILLTIVLLLIFLSGIILIIIAQGQSIVIELPQLMKENKNFLNLDLDNLTLQSVSNMISIQPETLNEYLSSLKGGLIKVIQSGYQSISSLVFFLVTCPIYIFFMLMYRNNVYRFIIAYQKKRNQNNDANEIIGEIKHNLFQYLKGMLIVMLVVGLLTYIGLLILGIKYALFLAILTAVLTPIPYIGVFVSATIPIIIAILTKDSIWYSVGVIIVFIIVQFLEGNIITPKIMGKNVNINPLIIILSLVIFGSIAGLLGMVLTIPVLAVFKVITEHSSSLRVWKYLLEDKNS